ncbi:M48 family metallopeptidase [Sphingorhabdus sp. Alg239-R122]|uniref:M48 family metallopeptidase n=1 Tax=Sphingorhabdus sp. Alg239-R122 TaxID=2305989 RepID=UPI0013DBA7F8|nr:M48 family metallopeptidase [Sphingorhabdus sp. Alg239-R122]
MIEAGRKTVLILAMVLCALPLSQSAAFERARVDGFKSLQAKDNRLLSVGYRLVSGSAPFCRDTEMRAGLALHDIAQYQDRSTAREAYGFARDIAVLAVAEGSPAQKAGIAANDSIVAINNADPLPNSDTRGKPSDKASIARLVRVRDGWENALAAGSVKLTLANTDGQRDITISPVKTCQSRFQLIPSKKFEASADGRLVSISTRMVDYTADDDELAAVIAHELAHNILRHLQRLEAAGHSDGLFGAFGRSARLTKQTEIEADRLSVWLMANAGYDPLGAIRFWNRYGKQHGKGVLSAPTHYRYKKRVQLFEEEIAKMIQMGRNPQGYAPPLLTSEFAILE